MHYHFGQFGKGDWSVLMLACRHPKLKTVELLLKNGADPNYTGKYKRTALMFASNDNKVASKLIEYGANVNAGNIFNKTSLMIAAKCGNFKTVKLLIDNGADVKSQNTEGKTALMFAEKRFFEINKYAKNFAKDKLKSESPHTYTILKEQQEIINYLKQFE